MRHSYALHMLLLATPLFAAEMKTRKDIPYVRPKKVRQTLDVYAPSKEKDKGKKHPIVVWIHGGGWKRGDKARLQRKPQAFVDQGYVLISTNYRFVPQVTVKEMTGDIAKAVRWAHDNADKFGGDPNAIFVMGHSAGAHLAALVCTDDRYLKAEGLSLSVIKGCVPVDVSVYDIPRRLKIQQPVRTTKVMKEVFGEDEKTRRDLSPVTHVAKGKHIPAFLILHVADRPLTKDQSHWLAEHLKKAGISAKVIAAEGTTHGTINSNLGLPKDKPTRELWDFMKSALKK